MTRTRLALIALLTLSLLSAIVWLALPGAPARSGAVKISASARPRDAVRQPITRSETAHLPIAASDEKVMQADERSYRFAREARDRAWANRSEAAIGRLMQAIPYVGGRHRLEIECAATLCEVRGIADADRATGSFRAVWQALERDTAGEELGKFGLQRVAANFDTGRNPDEFRIQYRRMESVTASQQTPLEP